jgi:hypothetical protein
MTPETEIDTPEGRPCLIVNQRREFIPGRTMPGGPIFLSASLRALFLIYSARKILADTRLLSCGEYFNRNSR